MPSPLCDECKGPNAIFIEDDRNLCRHHATIHDDHRPALNALMGAGLIYPANRTPRPVTTNGERK